MGFNSAFKGLIQVRLDLKDSGQYLRQTDRQTLCNVGFPVPCFLIYKVTVSPICTFTYFLAKYTGPLQSTARILQPSSACKLPPEHPS